MTGPVWDQIYHCVRAIPSGRVMTYGQISDLLTGRVSPLAVGWALNQCPTDVPWHRVVNASGTCSTARRPTNPHRQQRLLEKEGVAFNDHHALDLENHRWQPDAQ